MKNTIAFYPTSLIPYGMPRTSRRRLRRHPASAVKLLLIGFLLAAVLLTGLILARKTPFLTPNSSASLATQLKHIAIVANPDWPGDYKVVDDTGKTLAYMSAKYNNGRITDLKSVNGQSNIVASAPSSGAFYDHLILWPGNEAWSDGVLKSLDNFKVVYKDSNVTGYVQWKGKWAGSGFTSTVDQKLTTASYNGVPLLVAKTQTKFTATAEIKNFRHLYVELGSRMNDYTGVEAKTLNGIKTADVSGNSAKHFFDGEKLAKGDYIASYNSANLDAAKALVFGSLSRSSVQSGEYLPIKSGEIYVRAWDTDGIIDITDTLELHVTNPLQTYTPPYPFILKSGSIITLVYYTVTKDGTADTGWVPPISFLQSLF